MGIVWRGRRIFRSTSVNTFQDFLPYAFHRQGPLMHHSLEKVLDSNGMKEAECRILVHKLLQWEPNKVWARNHLYTFSNRSGRRISTAGGGEASCPKPKTQLVSDEGGTEVNKKPQKQEGQGLSLNEESMYHSAISVTNRTEKLWRLRPYWRVPPRTPMQAERPKPIRRQPVAASAKNRNTIEEGRLPLSVHALNGYEKEDKEAAEDEGSNNQALNRGVTRPREGGSL
jgi:hypothetical protein